jgi:hypothetical protein
LRSFICSWMVQMIIPNDVFFSHILNEINDGKSVRIPSKGNSMLPLIRPEVDEIELSPISENSIQKGNILLAVINNNYYVIHRAEKISSEKITLRGDGNIKKREICPTDSVIAEVTCIYRGNKRVTKSSLIWKITRICWFKSPLLRRIYLGLYRRIRQK